MMTQTSKSWMLPFAFFLAAMPKGILSFVVVGYVPEYRFQVINWKHIVRSTTHLNIFSVQPTEDGDLNVGNVKQILGGSTLTSALNDIEGSPKPKILLTVGGAGRSQAFPKVASRGKYRKKLARTLAGLFETFPVLDGVDFDWEAPTTLDQWRDFAKLVQEVRNALSNVRKSRATLITMAYHARTGAVAAFSQIQGASGKSFVDLFDFCHSMAYSQFDSMRRHSSPPLDQAAIDEWVSSGLPANKLTLGVPFFGVSQDTRPITFGELAQYEPGLLDNPGTDRAQDGSFFVGGKSLAAKVNYAAEKGIAGVMIWELGQDRFTIDGGFLLGYIWGAAQAIDGAWIPSSVKEEHIFGALTLIMAGYYSAMILAGRSVPPKLFVPPPKESRKED
eukprot:TRINITY_DN3105_c2_g1_i1.p1 TRINITY_DN3105_c2_g1~~TRINITY_DN3105_c2_g1_i1.p1  ORF type:complete len:390 (-),score=68.52 TRINITY_DN3105_c2_g1_i1:104-1273(-)